MAETRKHRVKVRDEIDQALLAALGEPVRPATPGADAAAEPANEPDAGAEPAVEPDASHRPSLPRIGSGETLGTFVFGTTTR